MLKAYAKMIARLLWFCDMVTTTIAFFTAYALRGYLNELHILELGGLASLDRYIWILISILVLWSVILYQYGAYQSYRTVSFATEIVTIWKAVVVSSILLGAITFVFKFSFVSRTLVVIFALLNLLFLTIERFVIRLLSWLFRKKGYNYRNVLIVGTGDAARDLAKRITKYEHWGLRLIGYIADGKTETDIVINGYPVIGDFNDLEKIVSEKNIDEVFFAVSGKRITEFEDALLMLEENGIVSRIVPNIFPHLIAKIQVEEIETVPLLTFTTGPTNFLALYVKRIFDIVFSVFLMISLAPLLIVVAIVIKLASSGPVFFKQKRCGLHGRIFTLYKFRSMYSDAEARKKDLEKFNEMGGPVFKIKDDPRITPFGRLIRKTSIDELPQLWNVLKGDMSIVGPRPPLPEEVQKYQRWQRRRLSMRPGITCLWQISGRNNIRDFDEWVKLDLQYIDTWSLSLDLKILLKTIPVVLFQKGAA